MILLVTPESNTNQYGTFKDFYIGPYSFSTAGFQYIKLDMKRSELYQAKGIYHENDVQHLKVTGKIVYHPVIKDCTAIPTADYPDTMRMPVLNTSGAASYWNMAHGFLIDRVVKRHKASGLYYHYVPILGEDGSWTIHELYGSTAAPAYFIYSYHLGEIVPYSGWIRKLSYKTKQYTVKKATRDSLPLNRFLTTDEVMRYFNEATAVSQESTNQYAYPTTYRARFGTFASPAMIKLDLDTYFAQLCWDVNNFPVEQMHFGDLAMKASKKVNANKVNMIAFLRDFQHPLEMIPKLKNLKKLRTHVNNYLTVHYGILPTISDIHEIFGAFKKAAPYLDRYGYKIFTSGNLESKVEGNTTFTLNQRIKLAIGNEDKWFEDLVERLDTIGMLPTMKNLWDLVPYSFVLDWFVDVGNFLERIDTRQRLIRLNIRYVTSSVKQTRTEKFLGSALFPYFGTVDMVYYHRWVSDQCPVPPLSPPALTLPDPSHWLEATALLLQRSKHI